MSGEKKKRPILDYEGRRFLYSSPDEKFLEEIAGSLKERYPDANFIIEGYGVEVEQVDDAGRAARWSKKEGEFSLWFRPIDAIPQA